MGPSGDKLGGFALLELLETDVCPDAMRPSSGDYEARIATR